MTRWQRKVEAATQSRRGQTLIIFALISLVLMGALGLVLDAGYEFGMRRQMQNAADAAALAGVRALTVNTSSPGVLGTVQQVVGQNGVANPSDSTQLTCDVLDNNLNVYASCSNTPFATGTAVSAVRVTVHENHPTFIMRALGIGSSNTGATATAQVSLLTQIANNQAPFLVCGVNTQTVGTNNRVNGQQSILQMSSGYYTYSSGAQYPATLEPPTILDSAYAIDWNNKPTLPNNSLGPRFLIHGASGSLASSVAPCTTGASSWKGINGTTAGTINIANTLNFTGSTIYPNTGGNALSPQSTTGNATTGNGDVAQSGQGTQNGPASAVPGAGGCPPAQDPVNCVLLIPILDDSVVGSAGGSGGGQNNYVAARLIEPFYITKSQSGDHFGQLIKNYPVQLQGTPTYTIGSTQTLVFRLVR